MKQIKHFSQVGYLLVLTVLMVSTLACGTITPALTAVTPALITTPALDSGVTLPSPPVSTPWPTYTPFPTCVPCPAADSQPTCAPCAALPASSVDLAVDTRLAELINDYRVANGQQALTLSYHLAYVAASRVQLAMLTKGGQSLDLGEIQIDTRTMPDNYAWTELRFLGDSDLALSMNTPQAALEYLIEKQSVSLLGSEHRDIGAALLCNGRCCGYIVILGRPYP